MFSVFFPAGVSSSQTASDCSYLSLLQHLNLTATNELLSVMRPVKNWMTPSSVLMDMYMYGILNVVSVASETDGIYHPEYMCGRKPLDLSEEICFFLKQT